ncbi:MULTISPECIES: hypothetical protein [Pseudomonas]|uniref:hypothetical protein n=1 Tax=Pseudomonas TaxID=286 RepID=UPI002364349F|nr:hypothetical protein [Pseudomonas putida]MDD1976484.1 hypothetical protein [Pseudomonas putida]
MKKGAMVPVLAGAGKSFLTLRTASGRELRLWWYLGVAPFCFFDVPEVLPLNDFGAPGAFVSGYFSNRGFPSVFEGLSVTFWQKGL